MVVRESGVTAAVVCGSGACRRVRPYIGAAAPRAASGPALRDPRPSGSLAAGYLAPIGWLGHVCRAVGSLWRGDFREERAG